MYPARFRAAKRHSTAGSRKKDHSTTGRALYFFPAALHFPGKTNTIKKNTEKMPEKQVKGSYYEY
jgi:hypothetical protein